MRLLLALLFAALPLTAVAAEPTSPVRAFVASGCQYEVRFVETGRDPAWREDLVMREKIPGKAWRTIASVVGVRLEKEVTLLAPAGEKIDALVISKPGGSAQFISVVEIREDRPGLRLLLDRALDKGYFDYRFDQCGHLIGFKMHYLAWHVSPDLLRGHAYTAVNVGWDSAKRRFRTGPVFVDDEAERKADLTDVLTAIGSDELLGVDKVDCNASRTTTYVHRPQGLLWSKTPPELRPAERVRVVIKFSDDYDQPPRIISIGAAAAGD